jgi:phospholipid/cholesterol/gamma-HCH transport system substrate-binding protein
VIPRAKGDRTEELGPVLTRIAAVGGLVALVVALALILFGRDDSYRVHAVFEDVRGLIPGGEVKAGAEQVGSVEDIEFNDRGLPVVTMEVDADFELRQGGFANIRTASNVGGVNRYVELTEGQGNPLGDGATLGPSDTDQPVDLDTALSDLGPRTRGEVAAVIAGVDAAVRGRGSDLDRALRHSALALGETAEVLNQVTSDRVALETIVEQGRTVVGALAASPEDVGEAAERLAGVLSTTAAREEELARASIALGPGLSSAREVLEAFEEAIPELEDLAAAARPAVFELQPTAREIRPAIDALRPLLAEAEALIEATPAQLRELRPVLRAALPVVARLDSLMGGLGPMLDYLRAWGPEVVAFFTGWADASANYDAAGNLARLSFTPIQRAPHTNLLDPFAGPVAGVVERPFYRTPGSLEGESEAWLDYWHSFIGGGQPVESHLDPEEAAP